jgi:hypothetical protein
MLGRRREPRPAIIEGRHRDHADDVDDHLKASEPSPSLPVEVVNRDLTFIFPGALECWPCAGACPLCAPAHEVEQSKNGTVGTANRPHSEEYLRLAT